MLHLLAQRGFDIGVSHLLAAFHHGEASCVLSHSHGLRTREPIHLLGQRYGVTPEDSSESIPALQVRLSADRAHGPDLQRLIWMPGGGESADARQRAFVQQVQEDPALHHRAEIIEGNLNLLKKDLIRRLAPPEEKPKAAAARAEKSQGGAPKLYLICDPKDEAAVEALEDYMFGQGLEVMLPAFDGDDAEASALHQDNLLTCHAVLIYYGAAPRAWGPPGTR